MANTVQGLTLVGRNNGNLIEQGYSLSLRPILTLKSSNLIQNGDGKSISTAYSFE